MKVWFSSICIKAGALGVIIIYRLRNGKTFTYEFIGNLKKKKTKNTSEIEFTSFSQRLLHHMLAEISAWSLVLHTWRLIFTLVGRQPDT
jgi:hypothetical protein